MWHYGDIKTMHGRVMPVVDVVTGGSPCQDLSVAGQRKGLSGERSSLFLEQIRIIKEMREHDREATHRSDEHLRPRFCIWENVTGALSSGKPKGADFAKVLEEFAKIAQPDLPGIEIPGGDGVSQDASTMRWEDGQLLGEFTMRSFGECPREENASHLSQILEDSAHQRYCLSARAAAGILRRAKEKGKVLPDILREALERVVDNEQGDND